MRPLVDIKTILATVFGGIGLFIASVVLNAFVSSPPTRAEFDTLKAESKIYYLNIDKRLEKLQNGQDKLIEHLILQRGKK